MKCVHEPDETASQAGFGPQVRSLETPGLQYCESWGIGENEKVKADCTIEKCFGIAKI